MDTQERDDPVELPLTPRQNMLWALNILNRHVYGGTVPAKEIKRRRAANKVARVSRRTNRSK